MAITLPSSQSELYNRLVNLIKVEAIKRGYTNFIVSPFSILSLFCAGIAGLFRDFYQSLRAVELQQVPTTAFGDRLDEFGLIYDLTRLQPTIATGSIFLSAFLPVTIPSGTVFNSNGNTYVSTASSNLVNTVLPIISITATGTLATAQVASTSGLASNMTMNINGAAQEEVNGEVSILVTSPTSFTYEIPFYSGPVTGSITGQYVGGLIPVESEDAGADKNLEQGIAVTLAQTVDNVQNVGYVSFSGVSGGTDEESDADFRERVLEKYQNPVTQFNSAAIISHLKNTVAGITRVWVYEATEGIGLTSSPGDVTILFVRDNDTPSIIPDGSELIAAKNAVVSIKPANTSSSDIYVLAPAIQAVNITISSLVPNTVTMRSEIQKSLKTLFNNIQGPGATMERNSIIATVWNTYDPVAAQKVETFNVTAPATTVTPPANTLLVLGTVSFV